MNSIELCLCIPNTQKPSLIQGIGSLDVAIFSIAECYQRIYVEALGNKGIDIIYGMKAIESIPVLKKACNDINNMKTEGFWKVERSHAVLALHTLISLARLNPDCIWSKTE